MLGIASIVRFASLSAMAGLLAACGTHPQRPAAESSPRAETAPAKAPTSQKKGGGYYLDDGPGDNPPDNLSALPDAEPRLEPLHPFANRPYAVFGREYVPAKQVSAYLKRGVASWYGRKFHGRKTAIGETYDMYAMTAAHPTLPLPSYARVTNVATGKSVVVRVNDRGPFIADRIIDLSYAAAHKLDYLEQGSTLVEVESIVPRSTVLARAPEAAVSESLRRREVEATEPSAVAATAQAPLATSATATGDSERGAAVAAAPEPATSPATVSGPVENEGIFVQLAAFSSNHNAERFRTQVLERLSWLVEGVFIRPKGGTYRLHVGPYRDPSEASRVAERIREALQLRPFVVGLRRRRARADGAARRRDGAVRRDHRGEHGAAGGARSRPRPCGPTRIRAVAGTVESLGPPPSGRTDGRYPVLSKRCAGRSAG